MGWFFHDNLTCFHCSDCKGPIEPGQALVKKDHGPCHSVCPQRRKTGFFSALKG